MSVGCEVLAESVQNTVLQTGAPFSPQPGDGAFDFLLRRFSGVFSYSRNHLDSVFPSEQTNDVRHTVEFLKEQKQARRSLRQAAGLSC
jgi:hypothetical protein